jgi:hypothetical protein
MPLRKIEDRDYATYWTEVVMPDDLANIAGPQPQYASFIRSALLVDLESLVRRSVSTQGARLRAEEWKPGLDYPVWSISISRDRTCTWRFSSGEASWSRIDAYGDAAWTFLEQDRFIAWPDATVSANSTSPDLRLDVLSNDQHRRIRLPDPSTLKAPLDPKLEDAVSNWLALLEAAKSPDAAEVRAGYRALLKKER